MTDVISEADRDTFARDAFVAIEAVLDRRCPETKVAFWTAVDLLYRLDRQPSRRPGTAARSDLPVRTPVPSRSGSSQDCRIGQQA